MIYIFKGNDGTCTAMPDTANLSGIDLSTTVIQVESLPEKVIPIGKRAILKHNDSLGLHWEYIDVVQLSPEERFRKMVTLHVITPEQFKLLTGKDYA